MRFVIVLHNHQPEGASTETVDRALERAYRPLVATITDHPSARVVMHHSGCLLERLIERAPDYVESLGELARDGRVEILTSPIYEPILPAIPERDRVAQLRAHAELIERTFGVTPRGAWLAERIWEPSLPKSLGQAGVEYCPLDDTPFLRVGFIEKRLYDSFQTEEEGLSVRVFPTPRSLGRLIPFARPEEVVTFLLKRQAQGAKVAVYAGPGEAFGADPGSHERVVERRWLARLLSLLENERHRIQTGTLAEHADSFAPAGQVYLPTGASTELLEWSLPPAPQRRHRDLRARLEREADGSERLLGTGFWRNFLVRYPESNWMHKRGLFLTERLGRIEASGADPEAVDRARRHLWRAQCHSAYWHGQSGGVYAPELRGAVHANHLAAWRIMDELENDGEAFLRTIQRDLNLDGDEEVLIENREIALTFAPNDGGTLVALDVKSHGANLLDAIARREESYHRALREQTGEARGRVKGRSRATAYLNYDPFPLTSFRDHFLPAGRHVRNVQELRTLSAPPARVRMAAERQGPGRLSLRCAFRVAGRAVALERRITLDPKEPRFLVEWELDLPDGLPEDARRFATECTFGSALAGAVPDLETGGSEEEVELLGETTIGSAGSDLALTIGLDPSARFMRFPVETVTLAGGAAERVFQGTRIFLAWLLEPTPGVFRASAAVDVRLSGAGALLGANREGDGSVA